MGIFVLEKPNDFSCVQKTSVSEIHASPAQYFVFQTVSESETLKPSHSLKHIKFLKQ